MCIAFLRPNDSAQPRLQQHDATVPCQYQPRGAYVAVAQTGLLQFGQTSDHVPRDFYGHFWHEPTVMNHPLRRGLSRDPA
jgi:hypothetical protein